MKQTLPLVVLTLMLVTFLTSQAQVKFVILSLKGKVEVSSGKSGKWRPATVGQELGKGDVVRTSFASYAKLMMNKERIISIDENRSTALATLAKQSSKGQSKSATGQILGYVSEQVSRSKEKKTGDVFGAVRGTEEVFSAVFPKYNLMSGAPTFTWVDMQAGQKYQLSIMDQNFKKVFVKEVEGVSYDFKDAEPALEAGRMYYWQIMRMSDSQVSEVQQFRMLPRDTVAAIDAELVELGKEMKAMGADEVTTHLIRGVYFEKRNLAFDAYKEYKIVLALAPDVQEYRQLMRNLLIGLKLYNELDLLM